MFYCDPCAGDLRWPKFGHSLGRCEMCGDHAVCSDIPSRNLPIPSDDQHMLVRARKLARESPTIQEEP